MNPCTEKFAVVLMILLGITVLAGFDRLTLLLILIPAALLLACVLAPSTSQNKADSRLQKG